jgi:hypothetical protein
MGGSCSINCGKERCIQIIVINMREREYLEDMGVDRVIILKRIFKQWEAA